MTLRTKLIILSLLVALPVYASEIRLLQPSFWERAINAVLTCKLNLRCYFDSKLGVSVTTILSTDLIKNSRTDINNNFTNLNNGKIENSTTSVAAITTLSALVTVGNITTGRWAGNAIAAANGGTGTTSMSSFRVLLGNGTGSTTVATSTGTAGQFLTSNGEGVGPSWQSASVDTTITYSWTGRHTFSQPVNASSTLQVATSLSIASTSPSTNVGLVANNGAIISGTTTISKLIVASSTIQLNGLTNTLPSSQSTNNGFGTTSLLVNDGNGVLSWNLPNTTGATTTEPGFTLTQVINHGLGRVPSLIKITATAITDDAGSGSMASSWGVATSTQTGNNPGQFAIGNVVRVAATAVLRTYSDTNSIINLQDGAGVSDAVADVVDINSTSFTLSWTTNDKDGVNATRRIIWEVY